jgi:hypothetical protein
MCAGTAERHKTSNMPKYLVKLRFNKVVEYLHEVEAESEDEAIELADIDGEGFKDIEIFDYYDIDEEGEFEAEEID